jgi:putative ABC transport system permease protein
MTLLGIAAKNVLRNKFRTVLTVVGAAIAILAFILLRTVLTAWNVQVDNAAKDRIGTRHKVTFIMSLPKRYIDTVRGTPGVTKATWASWFGGKDPKDPQNFFASLAVDPATFLDVYDEISVTPEVKERWKTTKQGAIVGDVLAKRMGLQVGDKLPMESAIYPGEYQFEIVGIYTATAKSVDRSQFLFQWDYLNDGLPEKRREQIGWIVSRIDDPSKSADISAGIDRIFDEKDVQTVTMSERAMNLSFMAMFEAILTALGVVSAIILGIMMMILGNTIAMAVRERTNEYGVLRAVGFLPKHVAMFIVGEAFTIGVLSALLGVAISYPIVEQGMGRWLEENMGGWFPYFQIDPKTTATAVLLAIALAVVASLVPAYRASKLPVTQALRRVG